MGLEGNLSLPLPNLHCRRNVHSRVAVHNNHHAKMGKKQERAERAEAAAMSKELDSSVDDDRLARMAEKLNTKPAVDNGAAELFAPKLSKEEKKAEAARKKAERDARKAEEKGQAGEDGADAAGAPAAASPPMKRKGGKEKESKADKVCTRPPPPATACHRPPLPA